MSPIEWLRNEFEAYGSPNKLEMSWEEFDELMEQAKEIEEQEYYECLKGKKDQNYIQKHIKINKPPLYQTNTTKNI